MQVERVSTEGLVINQLPDGSRVIVDEKNEQVFALNTTAGAAWDACSHPTTLAGVTESMQRSFDPAVDEGLAEEAILRLQEKNLVKTSGLSSRASRREFVAAVGSIALPLVAALSIGEQRAYALFAGSKGGPSPTPVPLPKPPLPPPPPPPPPPPAPKPKP
jgi:Coenzyme PQQ synthesis protein D (PqqD)